MPPTGRFSAGFGDQLREVVGEDDPAARGALFRRLISTLARSAQGDAPPPLEGTSPEPLEKAIEVALRERLLDETGALPSDVVGVALWEVASALPASAVRRELGRRVLASVHEGNASAFAAVATRMAVHGGKGLSGTAILARLALALWLPASSPVPADCLAFAVAMRRDLAARLVAERATGSLADRRLAARILERAAAEAARRTRGGAAQAAQPFVHGFGEPGVDVPPAAQVLGRLLADRESLVWRHAAAARGTLAGVTGLDRVLSELDPKLSVTEWRRAATSLAAAVAPLPDAATTAIAELLRGELVQRDPGIALALVWGLERPLAEQEDAAREVLGLLSELAPIPASEGVAELLAAPAHAPLREPFRACVETSLAAPEEDASLRALGRLLLAELEHGSERTELERSLASAVETFEHEGAGVAHLRALGALDQARELASALARGGDVQTELDALRLLDRSVLETETLECLLLLERKRDETERAEEVVELESAIGSYLEARLEGDAGTAEHLALPMRRLRGLVHLLDSRASEAGGERGRRLARAVLHAVASEGPRAPLRRGKVAAAIRALDAGARDARCEAVDVALSAWCHLGPADLEIAIEATANPDVRQLLRMVVAVERASGDRTAALETLAQGLPVASSQRIDGLRDALERLIGAVRRVLGARSRADLDAADARGETPLAALAVAARQLEQVVAAAEVRCLGAEPAASLPNLAPLEGVDRAPVDTLADAIEAVAPRSAFAVVSAALRTAASLPSGAVGTASLAPQPLPAWLGQKRNIGGFHVLRALGTGGVGSVFVATRIDEEGEHFALKVPDYHPRLVAQITEAEFLRLFRKEASALLELPEHPHLARFVTFDAGAKPKPILVMELVEGTRLDRAVARGALDAASAIGALRGVLRGLGAMHALGVGHLDLKPANVILRDGAGSVLVDFGLSGRAIRPGCTTPSYAAPEVWDPTVAPGGTPLTADVYAFGCVAYEVLTGKTLFEADTEVAILGRHLAHDGLPQGVRTLAAEPRTEPAGMFLFDCLRKDPVKRATVGELEKRLAGLERTLAGVLPLTSTPSRSP